MKLERGMSLSSGSIDHRPERTPETLVRARGADPFRLGLSLFLGLA